MIEIDSFFFAAKAKISIILFYYSLSREFSTSVFWGRGGGEADVL